MQEHSRVLCGRKGTRLTFLGQGKGGKVATRTCLHVAGARPGESFLFFLIRVESPGSNSIGDRATRGAEAGACPRSRVPATALEQ
jgi:hypothetical protein